MDAFFQMRETGQGKLSGAVQVICLTVKTILCPFPILLCIVENYFPQTPFPAVFPEKFTMGDDGERPEGGM